MSMWSGTIKLTQLQLKTTLFNDSNLPFLLEAGQVGEIFLQIPIADMLSDHKAFTKPVIIKIKDVFGLVKMRPKEKWDKEMQKEAFKQYVQEVLQQFELFIQNKQVLKDQSKKENQGGQESYVEALTARVINNIQVQIQNIYFRFEDKIVNNKTKKEENFSLGLQLREFSINSYNKDFESIMDTSIIDTGNLTYKKAKIEGFSIFCDWENINLVNNKQLSKKQEQIEFQRILDDEFPKDNRQRPNHRYLLKDFRVELKLTLNQKLKLNLSSVIQDSDPFVKAVMDIGGENDTGTQFRLYQQQILRILKTLEMISAYNEFKDEAIDSFEKNPSVIQINEYQNKYKELAILTKQHFSKGFNVQQKVQVEHINKKLNEFEVKYTDKVLIQLREQVLTELEQEDKITEKINKIEHLKELEIQQKIGFGILLSKEQKDKDLTKIETKYQKLKDIINGIHNHNKQQQDDINMEKLKIEEEESEFKKLPNNYLKNNYKVNLQNLTFTMYNEFNQKLIDVKTKDICCEYSECKNKTFSMLNIGQFEVQDYWSNGIENKIMYAKDVHHLYEEADDNCQTLMIKYETNDSFVKCPFKLTVDFNQSLTIVLIIPLINELSRTVGVAVAGEDFDFSYVTQKVTKIEKKIKSETQVYAESIKKGNYQHANADISLSMQAPVFKIYMNIFDENEPYLILDAGQINVSSNLKQFQKGIDYTKFENPDDLYDIYTIKLNKMKLTLNYPLLKGNEEVKMIEDISFTIDVCNNLSPLHKTYKSLRVHLKMNEIKFKVNLEWLKTLMAIKDNQLIELQQINLTNLQTRVKQRINPKQEIEQCKENIQKSQTAKNPVKDQIYNASSQIIGLNRKNPKRTFDVSHESPNGSFHNGLQNNIMRAQSELQEYNNKIEQTNTFNHQYGPDIEIIVQMQSLSLQIEDKQNIENDAEDEDYCLEFLMEGMKTIYRQENNLLDSSVEFSVDSFNIKDNLKLRHQNNMNNDFENDISVLNRIMCSPLQDIVSKRDSELNQNNFNQSYFNEEKDLYVEIKMNQYKYYDEDFQEIVIGNQTNVKCVINRSRILVNIPSIKQLIIISTKYLQFLNDGPNNFNEMLLKRKQVITNAILSQQKKQIMNSEEIMIIKQLENFGNSFDKKIFDTNGNKIENQYQQLFEVILSIQLQTKDVIQQNNETEVQKIFSKSEQDSISDNDKDSDNYSSSNQSNISNSQSSKLFFFKETYTKTTMNISLKLKNMELWVTYYDLNPSKKAQILQLKFMSNIYRDTDTFSKTIQCTKLPIQDLMKSQNVLHEDELIFEAESIQLIERVLEYDERLQANLYQLSIEQLLIQSWDQITEILIKLIAKEQTQKNKQSNKLNHQVFIRVDEFNDLSQDQIDQESTQFEISKILNDTAISVTMLNCTQYQQLRQQELEAQMDQLFIMIDFKDIDLLYYLIKMYEKDVAPALLQMSNIGQTDKTDNEDTNINTNETSPKKINENVNQNSPLDLKDEDLEEQEFEQGDEYVQMINAFKNDKYIMNVGIHSLILSLSDGEIDNFIGNNPSTPTPTIEFVFSNIKLYQQNHTIQGNENTRILTFPIDQYHYYNQLNANPIQYTNFMVCNLGLYATYFNNNSHAREPFIEPWQLNITQKQLNSYDFTDINISSSEMMNINFTSGMAEQIQEIRTRIFEKTFKIDDQIHAQQKKMDRTVGNSLNYSQALMNSTTMPQKNNLLMQSQTTIRGAKLIKQQQMKPGYNFKNYFGANLKFCLSDENLNEQLQKQQIEVSKLVPMRNLIQIENEERIIDLEGNSHNCESGIQIVWKNFNFFETLRKIELQKSQVGNQEEQQYFNDCVEDKPISIDVKIEGIQKIMNIPIEMVGVFSYKANLVSQPFQSEQVYNDFVNVIVNIQTLGKKRIINFESQLLITNNMDTPITLVFKEKKIFSKAQDCRQSHQINMSQRYDTIGLKKDDSNLNERKNIQQQPKTKYQNSVPIIDEQFEFENDQSYDLSEISRKQQDFKEQILNENTVTISAYDIFRVPLIYLMPESEVDVFILNYQHEQQMIFQNISQLFNKSTNEDDNDISEGIESQIIEVHDDLYISVDIKGYGCLPNPNNSPLQYVINLNPPLIICNYTMSPLRLFEIDKLDGLQTKTKFLSGIAPSMTDHITELNLTAQNTSKIKLQIMDNDSQMMLQKTVDFFEELTKDEQKFIRTDIRDSFVDEIAIDSRQTTCQLEIENTIVEFNNLKAYQQNFGKRIRYLNKGSSQKLIIYHQYMIVNKTQRDVYIQDNKEVNELQCIKSKSNDYYWNSSSTKIIIKVRSENIQNSEQHTYLKSQVADIKTIGLSGLLNLSCSDDSCNEHLQYGISFNQADYPYNKTTIITIVPKYLVINKTTLPIILREENEKMNENNINFLCQNEQQIELHFQGEQNKLKPFFHKVSFSVSNKNPNNKNLEETESEQQINSLAVKTEPVKWCAPFKVDILDDFQACFQMNEQTFQNISLNSNLLTTRQKDVNNEISWFYPQQLNNFNLMTRVILTEHSADNNSTTLIILDEPLVKQKIIKNETKFKISYCKYNSKTKQKLSDFCIVGPKEKSIYSWDFREIDVQHRAILIMYCDKEKYINCEQVIQQQQDLTQEKEKEKDESPGIIKAPKSKLKHKLLFNAFGISFYAINKMEDNGQTKIITISEYKSSRKSQIKGAMFGKDISDSDDSDNSDDNSRLDSNSQGTKIDINLQGFGFSFINHEPKELMYICLDNFALKYITKFQQDKQNLNETETDTEISLQIGNFQIDNLLEEQMPVLIGSKRYCDKHLVLASQSNSLSNLSNFYKIVEESDMKIKSKHREQLRKLSNIPFIKFYMRMNDQSNSDKLGRLIRYETIQFGIQEFFLQIETAIIQKILSFVQDINSIFNSQSDEDIMTNQESFEKSCEQQRKDELSTIDASQGVQIDEQSIAVDKISFGNIQITSIKMTVSIKIQQKAFDIDFSNPRYLFGLLNILYPFLAQLASITDHKISFNELIMFQGFVSQQSLIENISKFYTNQGLKQIYLILGASDIIGNPVGYVEKVGVSFIELVREPYMGMQYGPQAVLQGITTGIQGVVGGVIGGGFQTIGKMTGSFYNVIKLTTGEEGTNQENAQSIKEGVYFALKGIGSEVYSGATGLILKPIRGAKQQGVKGFAKGVTFGVAGAIFTPVTGVLRAGQSVSQGISGSAHWVGNYGKAKLEQLDVKTVRIRPERRIDLRGQIRIYSEDLAIISKLLINTNNKFFQGQQILFYSLLPSLDINGQVIQNKKMILLLTCDYIILMRVYNFLDLQNEKYFQKCLLLSEKIENIYHYSLKKQKSTNQIGQTPYYYLSMVFRQKYLQQRRKVKSLVSKMNLKKSPQSSEVKMAPMPQMPQSPESNSSKNQKTYYQSDFRADSNVSDSFVNQDNSFTYRYIFFSPSDEIFNRIDQLLSTMPKVRSNIQQYAQDMTNFKNREK